MLVIAEGRVLLVDFGLAGRENTERLTRTGAQLGSLPSMPPEHLHGATSAFEARMDVYSLGVMLYEVATLSLPFEGMTTAE